MAYIAANVNGEVTTDSARSRCQRVSSTEDSAASLDDVLALPNCSNHRARAHVLEKTREERLRLEVLIVLAEKLLRRLGHLEGNKLVATRLKTSQNLRNESSLDAVRLNHDEGLLSVRHIWSIEDVRWGAHESGG